MHTRKGVKKNVLHAGEDYTFLHTYEQLLDPTHP